MPSDEFDIYGAGGILGTDRISHSYAYVTVPMPDAPCTPQLSSYPCFVIDLITEGSGIHFVGGTPVPCKAGDVYVISPDTVHGYFVYSHGERMAVRRLVLRLDDWIKGDAAAPSNKRYCYGLFNDGSSVAYAMLNSSMREKTESILDSIECELIDKEREWRTVVRAYLIQLFTFISRYVNNSVKNAPEKSRDLDTVCAAIDIIKEEFGNFELSLEHIAKRVYTSAPSLSRSFKLYTGQLFSEYLRTIRLEHAAHLLAEQEMTVEAIVSCCGLKNISSFYRNFRDHFGMTPQLYRQVSKNKQINTKTDTNTKESETKRKMEILNEISMSVQNGRAKITKELVERAIEAGASVDEILNVGLLSGMSVVGEKFKNNEIYVPEVLVAARAMNMGVQILKPYLDAKGVVAKGRVCIGTVQGDLHDIGKNLVKMMMEGKGLEVIDLGTDVTPEAFIKAAVEQDCGVICCSALLTTTMSVMAEVVKAAETAGIRDKVKIMVGGAPVTQEFCDKIGADVYTVDAASAADAAASFFNN